MKRMRLNIAVVIMVILCMALPSQAEEAALAKTYSGDIWSCSTLTGDWGRTWLKEHGITLAPRLTQFYQGLAAGDGDHDFKYGGKADLMLNADLSKLGFWNGLSLRHRK